MLTAREAKWLRVIVYVANFGKDGEIDSMTNQVHLKTTLKVWGFNLISVHGHMARCYKSLANQSWLANSCVATQDIHRRKACVPSSAAGTSPVGSSNTGLPATGVL